MSVYACACVCVCVRVCVCMSVSVCKCILYLRTGGGSRDKRSFRGVLLSVLGMEILFGFEIEPQEAFVRAKEGKNYYFQVRDPSISASSRAKTHRTFPRHFLMSPPSYMGQDLQKQGYRVFFEKNHFLLDLTSIGTGVSENHKEYHWQRLYHD